MKVRILSVSKNYGRGTNGKKGICHESWIYGELEDGTKIEIFDMNCKFPKKLKKTYVNLLIFAAVTNEFSTQVKINGNIIENYKISEEWLKNSPELEGTLLGAIDTPNGIILIDTTNNRVKNIKERKNVNFFVVRFDLASWILME